MDGAAILVAALIFCRVFGSHEYMLYTEVNYAIQVTDERSFERFIAEPGANALAAAKRAFCKEWAKTGENDEFSLVVCAAPTGLAVGEYAIEEACVAMEGRDRMDACGISARECVACERARLWSPSLLTDDGEARAWEVALHLWDDAGKAYWEEVYLL